MGVSVSEMSVFCYSVAALCELRVRIKLRTIRFADCDPKRELKQIINDQFYPFR